MNTRVKFFKKFLTDSKLFLTFSKRGDIIENPFSDLSPKNMDTGKVIEKEVTWFARANNFIEEFTDPPLIINDDYTTVRQARGLWGEDEEVASDDVDFVKKSVPYYGFPNIPESKNADYGTGIDK
jgi:hypothetical protein